MRLLLCCVIAASVLLSAPSTLAAWTTAHGDALQSGAPDGVTPHRPVVAWQADLADGVGGVAVTDGVVFITAGATLTARDAGTGALAWSAALPERAGGGPAVADGRVFVTLAAGGAAAFDAATGAELWRFAEQGVATVTPAVGSGVVVYVARSGEARSLDAATGAVQWRYNLTDWGASSALVREGVVFVGTGHALPPPVRLTPAPGSVTAFDAVTGVLKWRSRFTDPVPTAPVFAGGRVLVAVGGDAVKALDPRLGIAAWSVNVNATRTWLQPAVTRDTFVAYSELEAGVVAFNASTGAERWRVSRPCDALVLAAHPPLAAGDVFVMSAHAPAADAGSGASHAALVAFDARPGNVQWAVETPASASRALAAGSGVIVLVTGTGSVTAFDVTRADTQPPVTAERVAISPVAPVAGDTVNVTVTYRNTGDKAATVTPRACSALADGPERVKAHAAGSVPAGGVADVTVRLVNVSEGAHAVRVALPLGVATRDVAFAVAQAPPPEPATAPDETPPTPTPTPPAAAPTTATPRAPAAAEEPSRGIPAASVLGLLVAVAVSGWRRRPTATRPSRRRAG